MNWSNIKYVTFAFLLIPIFVGCNSNDEHSDVAFVKFFGDGTNDYGVDVCENNNTIYVLSNAEDKETGKESPYLYFFNTNGEFIDSPLAFKEFSDSSSYNAEYSQKILCDDDNNLFIISNVVDTLYNEKIFVRKIKGRSVQWSKYCGENLYSVSSLDAILSDNNIVIIGNTIKNSSDNNTDAYILKISQDNGNFVGDRIVQGRVGDEQIFNLIKGDDGYYFTGYSESYFAPGVTQERAIWTGKFVEEEESYVTYMSFGSERINEGRCLENIGNKIIVASNERRTEDEVRKLKVYGINALDLKVEWETTFDETKNLVPVDIISTNNGFLILANKFPSSRVYGNICVLYYDIDGNYIAKKELGPGNSDATLLQANKSIFLGDELLIIGNNGFNENSDVALIKLNSSDVTFE